MNLASAPCFLPRLAGRVAGRGLSVTPRSDKLHFVVFQSQRVRSACSGMLPHHRRHRGQPWRPSDVQTLLAAVFTSVFPTANLQRKIMQPCSLSMYKNNRVSSVKSPQPESQLMLLLLQEQVSISRSLTKLEQLFIVMRGRRASLTAATTRLPTFFYICRQSAA